MTKVELINLRIGDYLQQPVWTSLILAKQLIPLSEVLSDKPEEALKLIQLYIK